MFLYKKKFFVQTKANNHKQKKNNHYTNIKLLSCIFFFVSF